MKYYVTEHLHGYQEIAEKGKSSWDELHGSAGYEDAAIRHRLALALPHCRWQSSEPRALEYGCGTGPGACYLAEHGFQVMGIDLNPTAIAIARREAAKRSLKIDYTIGDVCALPQVDSSCYDLIVDSFCLQSIVTNADRASLFHFVKSHLAPDGYYLVCCAGFSPTRRYDDVYFDPQMGIVYALVQTARDEVRREDVVMMEGKRYVPYRRHLRVVELANELAAFNFQVIWQQVDPQGNLSLLSIV
jgi:SAM-dependent methyltransferase